MLVGKSLEVVVPTTTTLNAESDATPAVEGSYSAYRQSRAEIAQQYLENPMLNKQPAFDVIFGGGIDQFVAAGRKDGRNLVQEFQDRGFRYVTTASDLKNILYVPRQCASESELRRPRRD